MDITEVSILHHIGIVLSLLFILSSCGWCHPVAYLISFIYLFLVNERYILRLRRRLQFEERKQASQKRVLSDSETVRWLNHAVEKIWPICLEEIASQKLLLPIIPWFLDKYKPWTAKKAVLQNLYLGRNPPMFTEIRVVGQTEDDDHLVLELGMNFRSGDDMSAVLDVKLTRRLGFGMWAKLNITGMHVEGKVLVGVKFLQKWPFLGRCRICFVEPPYFQMTVKPIFSHGVDVTEVPGFAGWLDKLLAVAFEQTLVEPNMLVVDVEKLATNPTETWFSMDEKRPIAFAKVEILEGADMKPSDLNGLADPYVKGKLGPYSFRTKIHKKTLTPKWQEEFKIPICTWESPNVLHLEVRDKDHFVDDTLGDCSINISEFRGGQRHDKWLPLQNIKMGRLHLAIKVNDVDDKEKEPLSDVEPSNRERSTDSEDSDLEDSNHPLSSKENPKVAGEFEPINIAGQERTGIWVHHPGNEVSHTWEPRQGGIRRPETQLYSKGNDSALSLQSVRQNDNDSSSEENPEGNGVHPLASIRKSMRKIGSVFHKSRSPRSEASSEKGSAIPTPRANIQAEDDKVSGIRIIVDDVPKVIKDLKGEKDCPWPETDEMERSPGKSHQVKGMAMGILKHAGKSAHGIKNALNRRLSMKSNGRSALATEGEKWHESESTDDSVRLSKEYTPRSEGESLISAAQFGSDGEAPIAEESDLGRLLDSRRETEDTLAKKENLRTSESSNGGKTGDISGPSQTIDRKVNFKGLDTEGNQEVDHNEVHGADEEQGQGESSNCLQE
ncbi:C2 domain-containing protein At1g53590-like [Aristolochia californica]|uniref:C2 domain-containing protein At1g53590-like n=1 Tax=Aristolochia californica TaxID=171875 RepID=UPI0035DFB72C